MFYNAIALAFFAVQVFGAPAPQWPFPDQPGNGQNIGEPSPIGSIWGHQFDPIRAHLHMLARLAALGNRWGAQNSWTHNYPQAVHPGFQPPYGSPWPAQPAVDVLPPWAPGQNHGFPQGVIDQPSIPQVPSGTVITTDPQIPNGLPSLSNIPPPVAQPTDVIDQPSIPQIQVDPAFPVAPRSPIDEPPAVVTNEATLIPPPSVAEPSVPPKAPAVSPEPTPVAEAPVITAPKPIVEPTPPVVVGADTPAANSVAPTS